MLPAAEILSNDTLIYKSVSSPILNTIDILCGSFFTSKRFKFHCKFYSVIEKLCKTFLWFISALETHLIQHKTCWEMLKQFILLLVFLKHYHISPSCCSILHITTDGMVAFWQKSFNTCMLVVAQIQTNQWWLLFLCDIDISMVCTSL